MPKRDETDSDATTLRPPRDRPPSDGLPRQRSITPAGFKRWAQAHNVLSSLWQTLTIIGVVIGAVWGYLQSFSTDAERVHDDGVLAIRQDKLQAQLTKLTNLNRELAAQQTKNRSHIILLWRDRVSLRAAERESVAQVRAAAASYYRDEYDRLIRQGLEPDDAARESLRSTWPDRARLLRHR